MTYQVSVDLNNELKNKIVGELLFLDPSKLKCLQSETITNFVDARGLSCPQPLLKLKMALRSASIDQMVYLVATDANSELDIQSYARHSHLILEYWQTKIDNDDTIFHFLIKKNK